MVCEEPSSESARGQRGRIASRACQPAEPLTCSFEFSKIEASSVGWCRCMVCLVQKVVVRPNTVHSHLRKRWQSQRNVARGGASRKPCRLTSSLEIETEANQGCNHLNEPLLSLARSSGRPDLIMLTPTMLPVHSFLFLNDVNQKIGR